MRGVVRPSTVKKKSKKSRVVSVYWSKKVFQTFDELHPSARSGGPGLYPAHAFAGTQVRPPFLRSWQNAFTECASDTIAASGRHACACCPRSSFSCSISAMPSYSGTSHSTHWRSSTQSWPLLGRRAFVSTPQTQPRIRIRGTRNCGGVASRRSLHSLHEVIISPQRECLQ